MNKTILAVLHLAAAGQLLLVKPAHGITFNFNWTSDAPGLTVVEGGPAHIATGTVDINVLPGADFTASDVSNIDITMGNGTYTGMFNDAKFVVRWSKIVHNNFY